MLFNSRNILASLFILAMIISIACSSNKTAIEPPMDNSETSDIFGVDSNGLHNLVAGYDVEIDSDTMTVNMEPMNRSMEFHFPLTNYYPNVLAITGYGYDPGHNNDFYADIRLRHPYIGSEIKGFDARVIAILPANDGVSFFYPTFNVRGNNAALINYDDYTGLWDSVGGTIPGNVNPFIAFFKSEANRVWDPNDLTEDTQRFYIDLDGFAGPMIFKLVVDVSTVFPNQSLPIIDNAKEPVSISAEVMSDITPSGGTALVEVTFLDWQGVPDIKCKIECPDLFNLGFQLYFDRPGPNPDEYIFSGVISNDLFATPGDHDLLVAAWDIPTNVKIYDETVVRINLEPSAWNIDPARANVDLDSISDMYPPKPGSDLGVVDNADAEIGGLVMYEIDDMVVKMDLALTTCELHGYSYMPNDGDPSNPHPDPEIFPAGRIDAQETGHVVQSWDDGHLGGGPDLAGQFQREDALIGIMEPNGSGWIDYLIGAYPNMANDNPITPDYDESLERPRLTDVYEEYDDGHSDYNLSGIWTGTTVWDVGTGNTFNPIGVMGGIKSPYYNDPFITMDWGLWIFTGPPTNEIKGADASKDIYCPYQYWGFSGIMTGPALVGKYDKDGATLAAFQLSDLDANLLDLELIPRQDPPLEINGFLQDSDWVCVLLDNNTIEIFNPDSLHGDTIDIIDLSVLEGQATYIDIQNTTANIFVSHTDGITPYCSVFILD